MKPNAFEKTTTGIVIVALAALAGCQSAEERCNAAKLEAYDAWDAWARRALADAQADEDACASVRGSPIVPSPIPGLPPSDPFMECVVRQMVQRHMPPDHEEIGRVRDRARGGAIPFRDAVQRLRDAHAEHPETLATPEAQHAFGAADSHWERCSTVSP
jgi:hypothetical protein